MIEHAGNVQPQLDLEEHAHISGVPGKKVFNIDSSGNVINFDQTTMISLIETLQELVQRLAPLGGAMANTAQLRAVVTGAVTATGGGYITNAQMVAALLTQTNSLTLNDKQFLNNIVAINSNINNCVVT